MIKINEEMIKELGPDFIGKDIAEDAGIINRVMFKLYNYMRNEYNKMKETKKESKRGFVITLGKDKLKLVYTPSDNSDVIDHDIIELQKENINEFSNYFRKSIRSIKLEGITFRREDITLSKIVNPVCELLYRKMEEWNLGDCCIFEFRDFNNDFILINSDDKDYNDILNTLVIPKEYPTIKLSVRNTDKEIDTMSNSDEIKNEGVSDFGISNDDVYVQLCNNIFSLNFDKIIIIDIVTNENIEKSTTIIKNLLNHFKEYVSITYLKIAKIVPKNSYLIDYIYEINHGKCKIKKTRDVVSPDIMSNYKTQFSSPRPIRTTHAEINFAKEVADKIAEEENDYILKHSIELYKKLGKKAIEKLDLINIRHFYNTVTPSYFQFLNLFMNLKPIDDMIMPSMFHVEKNKEGNINRISTSSSYQLNNYEELIEIQDCKWEWGPLFSKCFKITCYLDKKNPYLPYVIYYSYDDKDITNIIKAEIYNNNKEKKCIRRADYIAKCSNTLYRPMIYTLVDYSDDRFMSIDKYYIDNNLTSIRYCDENEKYYIIHDLERGTFIMSPEEQNNHVVYNKLLHIAK